MYFGIVDKNGTKVTLLNGNGEIYLTNGIDNLAININNLTNDSLESNTANIETLTVRGLDASDGFVTVATPSANNNPTTKEYVDTKYTELTDKIKGIEAAQNLLDIVANKSDLNTYPQTHLQENDKIKVLVDETNNGAGTYYKWTLNEETGRYNWHRIGQDGNYYTQAEVDTIKNNLQAQIESLKALVTTLTANNVSYKGD